MGKQHIIPPIWEGNAPRAFATAPLCPRTGFSLLSSRQEPNITFPREIRGVLPGRDHSTVSIPSGNKPPSAPHQPSGHASSRSFFPLEGLKRFLRELEEDFELESGFFAGSRERGRDGDSPWGFTPSSNPTRSPQNHRQRNTG